jgi:Tol biopolymer transport system component
MADLSQQLQTTLGDGYSIDREIGGGGMSRVFLATEKAFARQIVIKVVPSDAASAVSVERFKREIQVAARLQHPHIVPVVVAGETDGVPFYTMPFVEGESLRARLNRSGELSINETLHILRDVASALAYAHAKGVVHRDIKPENVILTTGVAVVTDFGVAKAMDLAVTDGGSTATGLTSLGVALGTPAYMSPEQATADPHVDHRADIYSFGCVAYEMLAGSSPFAGRPLQQLLAAHVGETPAPLGNRRATTPTPLAALVMRCLEKRAGDRPQSADELITAIDSITTPSGGSTPTAARIPAAKASRGWRPVAAAVVVLAAIGGAVTFWPSGSTGAPSIGRTIAVASDPELELDHAISPSGDEVAYSAETPNGVRVFTRQIDGGRANMLSAEVAGDQFVPAWSPDGLRISFIVDGSMYVVPARGGSPKRVFDQSSDSTFRLGNGSVGWSPDGKEIAVGASGSILIVSVETGKVRRIPTVPFTHSPSWSPDGKYIAYAVGLRPTFNNVSGNLIMVVAAAGGAPVRMSDTLHVNVSPVWMPDGKGILFVSTRGGARDVYLQPVAPDGRPRGEPARLTTGLGCFTISLSADGKRLSYDVVRNFSNIWAVPLIPGGVATAATARQITRENQHIEAFDISPDGRWLAYDSDRGGNFDIYKVKLTNGAIEGAPVAVTTNRGNDFAPAWSPDGRELVFHSSRSGEREIYVIGAEGGGERQVTNSRRRDWYGRWLDGQRLVFASDSGGPSQLFVTTRGSDGSWSPPRLWGSEWKRAGTVKIFPAKHGAAYNDNGSIGVAPLDGGPPQTIGRNVKNPSFEMRWSPDGSTLFVLADDGIYAAPASGAPARLVLSADPAYSFARPEFATDGVHIFFTRPAYESDVWVMDLVSRGQSP